MGGRPTSMWLLASNRRITYSSVCHQYKCSPCSKSKSRLFGKAKRLISYWYRGLGVVISCAKGLPKSAAILSLIVASRYLLHPKTEIPHDMFVGIHRMGNPVKPSNDSGSKQTLYSSLPNRCFGEGQDKCSPTLQSYCRLQAQRIERQDR